MCGRAYAIYKNEDLEDTYGIKLPLFFPTLEPNYNIPPQTQIPAVIGIEAKKESKKQDQTNSKKPFLLGIDFFQWGLIPFWAKDPKIASKLINARAETIDQKPSFKAAIRSRRCSVPVSGFFEWK